MAIANGGSALNAISVSSEVGSGVYVGGIGGTANGDDAFAMGGSGIDFSENSLLLIEAGSFTGSTGGTATVSLKLDSVRPRD
jgi:hypothetical protein